MELAAELEWSPAVKKTLIVGATLLVAAALVVMLGTSWNFIEQKRLLAENPPPGQFFVVNGHSMHLDCSGTGRITIVAEAGSGEDSLTWTLLQRSLRDQLRFCSYDRAGMGWSEAKSTPRDADAIAQELHTLLLAANERGPFVLLAHSLGGLYIRKFEQKYPSETTALIFLDAVTPATYTGTGSAALGLDEASVEQRSGFRFLDWAEEVTGYARLLHQCSDVPAPLAAIHKLYEADQCIASQDAEQRMEGQAIEADLQELSSQPINIPVLILSEDKSPTFQTPQAIATWNQLQSSMLTLSPQSYRVIASNSDHFLQIDCPTFATEEIRRFLQVDGASPPRQYGTTTTLPCR